MRILRFNAIWCSGCLVMKSRWKKIEKIYPNLDITDYDYDINEEEVEKWQIGDIIPVVIFLDENNQEIIRLIGEKKEQEIINLIESNL